MRENGEDRRDRHGHLPGDRLDQCLRAAPVGDVHDVHARHRLQELAGEMPGRSNAGRGEVDLPGAGARERDQLLGALHRQRRVHRHHHRHDGDLGDRCEIAHRVIRQVAAHAQADGVGRRRSHHQRVAVGRRLEREIRRDDAAAAGPRIHEHLLARPLGELHGHRAREDVRPTGRRERHDDPDGFHGIVLRRRLHRGAREKQRDRCEPRQP